MKQLDVAEEAKYLVDFEDKNLSKAVRVFQPLVYMAGETFCVMLGPDAESGVFGKGISLEDALQEWETQLKDRIRFHKEEDEVANYIIDTLKTSKNKVW